MSQKNNNNFDELKRALKLKQHEIPPPGYFNRFSGEVVSRIRAGESGGSEGVLDQLGFGPWLTNLLQSFQGKPGLIGSVATALCLLLLGGVVLADRPDGASSSGDVAGTQTPGDGTALASAVSVLPTDGTGITISTNPVISLQPVATLFGSQQNPLFQTVGFIPAGQ